VRVDSGVESGSEISPYYDAMVAKVIAHAPARAEAAGRLAAALAGSRLHGTTTNRDLLVRILREPEFLAGATDTAYLERHDPAVLAAPLLDTDEARRAHLAVATVTLQLVNRRAAVHWSRLPSGWRNNPALPQRLALDDGAVEQQVSYRVHRSGVVELSVDDEPIEVQVHSAANHVVNATVDGVRRSYQVVIPPDQTTIDVDSPLGSSSYRVVPRFHDPAEQVAAGSLVAPMPGAVVRILVEPGAAVTKGDPLVVLEAMKMEHTVASPTDGTVVEVRVEAGKQVDAGAVLAVVEAPPTEND
jgi:acetyl/propionyl-CoA carboxylase alpha subunit